jgi:hypothetical protein
MPTLKLPFSDRIYSVKGDSRDLSIIGPLEASGGFWEPYLMSVMADRISRDDVCFDIGANIGLLTS